MTAKYEGVDARSIADTAHIDALTAKTTLAHLIG